MLKVTKASGIKEKFEKQKIISTCLRMGASVEIAQRVADEVYRSSYPGIPTKEILRLIFRLLGRHVPEIKFRIDLRQAIARLRPKPDFEQFIRLLLQEHGYEVLSAQMLRGKCIEHEIDGIAKKGREVLYLEVKHHFEFHTLTPLEVPLSVWATLQDLKDGFRLGYNRIRFTNALIVCNTKFSSHAREYALCRGMKILAWNFPADSGLNRLMEGKNFFPITLLRGLDRDLQERLGNLGIVSLKQLAEADIRTLAKQLRIKKEKLSSLAQKAKALLDLSKSSMSK